MLLAADLIGDPLLHTRTYLAFCLSLYAELGDRIYAEPLVS